MNTATFTYDRVRGWSRPAFPALDSERTLVLAFAARSWSDDPAPLRQLAAAYPRSHLLGCSTAGEIGGRAVADDTISVAVARFAGTSLRSASATVEGGARSALAGEEIARQLAGPGLRSVMVISDGLNVNGSELIRGLNSALPPEVVVTGGLAGDGGRFQQTWVLHQGTPRDRLVSAVGFYGPSLKVGHGSRGGWDIFGPERRVTRSAGNVLHEIDGQPALDLYRNYLGDLAAGLPANALLFPLSLRRSGEDDTRLVRTILSIDEQARSLTFAGDIPEGSLVQLMRANFDRLIDGASEAGRLSRGDRASKDALTIAISCVGRRLVLGERADEEVEAVMESMPAGAPLVGFYSYGEIFPYTTGRCELHNQTMTLTTLAEG